MPYKGTHHTKRLQQATCRTCRRNFQRLIYHPRFAKSGYCSENCRLSWFKLKRKGLSTFQYVTYHLHALKANARKRKLLFELTPAYIWEMYLQQGGRCKMTNIKMVTSFSTGPAHSTKYTHPRGMSVDRVDSRLGYIEGNIRLVTNMYNCCKHTFTDRDVRKFATKMMS